MNFRFFIADSDLWADRVKLTLDEMRERKEEENKFKDKYGASGLYQHGRFITGLGWYSDEKRKGWIFQRVLPAAGDNYYCYKPDRRSKIGKEAAEIINHLNRFRFSFSTRMVSFLPAEFNQTRATARTLYFPVAGHYKGKTVFKIPCAEDFNLPDITNAPVPEGLREIKESEFVAITKE